MGGQLKLECYKMQFTSNKQKQLWTQEVGFVSEDLMYVSGKNLELCVNGKPVRAPVLTPVKGKRIGGGQHFGTPPVWD